MAYQQHSLEPPHSRWGLFYRFYFQNPQDGDRDHRCTKLWPLHLFLHWTWHDHCQDDPKKDIRFQYLHLFNSKEGVVGLSLCTQSIMIISLEILWWDRELCSCLHWWFHSKSKKKDGNVKRRKNSKSWLTIAKWWWARPWSILLTHSRNVALIFLERVTFETFVRSYWMQSVSTGEKNSSMFKSRKMVAKDSCMWMKIGPFIRSVFEFR